MGMSYEDYWERDVELAYHFRKWWEQEERHKQKIREQSAWMNGLYEYVALARVSPILHAFADPGTEPEEYLTEPIGLFNTAEERKQKEMREIERKQEEIARKMDVRMKTINKAMKKGGEEDS